MYFYKSKGKQVLDMRGDLVLTHNDDLVRSISHSAAPRRVTNATYIKSVVKLSFAKKIKATVVAARFIWGKTQELRDDVRTP